MNITILEREFDEIEQNLALFEEPNFRMRKEALDFVATIEKLNSDNLERAHLEKKAQELKERLYAFNATIAEKWLLRLKSEKPTPKELGAWFQPYTEFVSQRWGEPHYGYENLDFLLNEILLPLPHPKTILQPEYGMVRYEPTPASVIVELTERITFTENDYFYDLGSGLGKITSLMHLLTGTRSMGVEYQPTFCTYAAQQANRLYLKDVKYLNADARYVDYTDATVFFFFNPFGGVIFDRVLERLRSEAEQREIIISSYGSSSQPLSELPWLEYIPPINSDENALAIFRGRA
ncbi:MAG: hypothetical protein GY755_14250 [Chloroflexi bacterium]|nr:hypothetical protein [Chloroflexota bacterium]